VQVEQPLVPTTVEVMEEAAPINPCYPSFIYWRVSCFLQKKRRRGLVELLNNSDASNSI
jgi:hypothetical protein